MHPFRFCRALALATMVGGCAGAGAATVDDATIDSRVAKRLDANDETQRYEIDAGAIDNVVTLRGEVAEHTERVAAEKIARETPGVDAVHNMVMVRNDPRRDAIQRSVEDSMLADKIAARLNADRTVRPFDIEVEVTGGLVTLTGFVSGPTVKARAERIVRDTEGVATVTNDLRVVTQR
jgi:osmotically-inducible protein OsmY